MIRKIFHLFILVSLALLVTGNHPLWAQTEEKLEEEKFTDQQLEYFENKVRPLLVEHCYDCHGPDASPIEGSLSLVSRKSILSGGDTGPAIVSGHPEKSLLIDAINYGEVYEMPPDTKLAAEDIEILTKWVKDGAAWPKSSDVEVAAKEAFDIKKRKSEHWCWAPIKKAKPPIVKNAAWPADPIDAFILHKVESAGLEIAKTTDKRTLIRRAYFDIVGLPPTPEQVQKFVEDKSENAFEKVIDELLASPQFGERWGRHWLDLARYAETGGHEFDYAIPYAHRYRDYVIRAFNADVSYKQLLHEHIAGDLIAKPRRHETEDYNESIIGTGFWFLHEAKHGPVDAKAEEARTIDNQIDVMSKTFLGLTVACARCHDHKFDAISTEDFYALSGFLQSSRRQNAMLDPGRKIETSFAQATKLVEQGSRSASNLIESLRAGDPDVAAKYINTAVELLRQDETWNNPSTTIQGESMKEISVTHGTTEIQTIRPQGKLNWQGDKQNWWRDAKRNSVWKLEFDNTGPAGDYKVTGVFTVANDYGAASISLNEKMVKKRVDFYASELSTTKTPFGRVQLKKGKNQLTLRIAKPNKKAIARNMIGIDYLEISPINVTPKGSKVATAKIAKERSLNETLLKKLIQAFKDPALKNKTHPLHLIHRATRADQSIDAAFIKTVSSQFEKQTQQHAKWLKDSTLFEDFNDLEPNGLPTGWFRTGFAFGPKKSQPAKSKNKLHAIEFSHTGGSVRTKRTIHSGQFGTKFFGAARSATFELNTSHIHYRVRGKNVTVRLVIDGFMMDEFNALLFRGCKFDIPVSDSFVWHTQADDLKNHLGHRAYIEVLDHGDGWVELDEIRFSNGARPADEPNELVKQITKSESDSVKSFSSDVALGVLDSAKNSSTQDISNWIINNDVVEVFAQRASENGKSLSNLRSPDSRGQTSQVSLVANASTEKLIAEIQSVREKIDALMKKTPRPFFAHAMTDGTGEEEFIHIRGNHKTLGKVATRHFLTAISPRPLNPADGSGRLKLAQKMTAPNNPLTSRVAVNRIWHHMFGRGIVESVDNFGVLGKRPTHPKLLDYLAREFSSDGWSIKRMIKRIALTKTYQMSSQPNPDASSIDPDNNLLHRARIRRLQGEAIRDSILAISGRLDLKMYGPPIPIHLTKFMQGRGRPRRNGLIDGAGRRSIYIAVRRNFLSPMMLAFDTPIPFNTIGKRNQSNVPAQALIMMNDPFVIEQSKLWAESLVKDVLSTEQRIKAIYLQAFGREPSEVEAEKAQAFIKTQANALKVNDEDIESNVAVWQDFCHIVFNLKEFIYIN